ncbi:MAG: glycoside hydrolase family 97 protein [Ignavibacteria bacterium]|nr:glycoside hydrolase family 97 protein [Ignavibacteria bacterium]
MELRSPNGRILLDFTLNDGRPGYALTFDGRQVLTRSSLGIRALDSVLLEDRFVIAKLDSSKADETWKPVWGESSEIRNQYSELSVRLRQQGTGFLMVLRFRLFNDGLGFRYEFPQQEELGYFTVTDELTEFNLTGDHTAFWIPGDYDTNEYKYSTGPLSTVDASIGRKAGEIYAKTPIGPNVVQSPLMMKSADGLYINIHEAALLNYPAMNLEIDQESFSLRSHLVPNPVGSKAFLQTPCVTPWRTLIVSDRAEEILTSRIILNLNEPSKIVETGWITPMKYVGIWWELHIGKSTWNYADVANVSLSGTDWDSLRPNGRHGATTERTKRYIDFAAEHGFGGVLVEGWNIGWEDWFGKWKEEVFDFVTPYPDFAVDELQGYAAAQGVKLIMHHETSSSVTNYERRMDEAFGFMKDHGYDAVKTGYVGRIIPRGEFHDGQWMINHYVRVAEKAASYGIMVNAHEPVRPTGLHRTYPNWLACEAARGNEFNAWSSGNPPEHETILPFTRLMGGPMDYTPGIFQITMDYWNPDKTEQVHTTLAKQLALYVTLYSPLQMAADLPESYERFPDAFQFIKDVPVDWDETRILHAEPGDYVVIARKGKGSGSWFLGAITDEERREFRIGLDFLESGREYNVTVYADAVDAHWKRNPMAYTIRTEVLTSKDALNLILAAGGGAAVSIVPTE